MPGYHFDESYIRHLIEDQKLSQAEVFERISNLEGSPITFGLSLRSLKRFIEAKGISRKETGNNSRRIYSYDEKAIRHMIEDRGMTQQEVFVELKKAENGNDVYGLSARSLKRFCSETGISNRSCLPDEKLDVMVATAVATVGPSYGHRMLRGHLLASGSINCVSKHRVRASLRRVDAENVAARSAIAKKKLKPRRYHAPYFGYNLHVDQNEKLVDFGIVYVAAIDGHSSFVFDIAVMPRKNNLAIYRDLYKPILEQHGLFRHLLSDGGLEFMLAQFMQMYYWKMVDPDIDPLSTFRKMPSTLNNRIERYWEENNERVTGRLKEALIALERAGRLNMELGHHRFGTSEVGMMVAKYGATLAANAWNCHHIENRGIPRRVAQANNGATAIRPEYVIDVDAAKNYYRLSSEQQRGAGTGRLTEESSFGNDLLKGDEERRLRRDSIFRNQVLPGCGGLQYVFGQTANGQFGPFQNLILYHFDISEKIYRGEM